MSNTPEHTANVQGTIEGYEPEVHVQGSGPNVNRAYGVAVTFSIPNTLRNWFEQETGGAKSLANSNKSSYQKGEAWTEGDQTFIRFFGDTSLNDEWGALIRVSEADQPELYSFVAQAEEAAAEASTAQLVEQDTQPEAEEAEAALV